MESMRIKPVYNYNLMHCRCCICPGLQGPLLFSEAKELVVSIDPNIQILLKRNRLPREWYHWIGMVIIFSAIVFKSLISLFNFQITNGFRERRYEKLFLLTIAKIKVLKNPRNCSVNRILNKPSEVPRADL